MDENKQAKLEGKPSCSPADKKSNRDVLKRVIIGLAVFAVVCLIFWIGMFVGGTKARFSYRWAESYHKNFAGPREGFFGNWQLPPPSDFINSHGTFGQIIEIKENTLVIKGRDDVEKIVLIKDDTTINRFRETIKASDLKVNDFVVVIGSPNEAGQIEAKLIRVLPPAPLGFMPESLRRPRY